MSARSIGLDDDLHRYLVRMGVRETPAQRGLREATAQLAEATMQISPEQGQLMRLLAQLTGMQRAVEIGTFTGYSALSLALGMPATGELVCIDRSAEWTAVGRPYWEQAGVAERIELRLGEGAVVLAELLEEAGEASFDFAFIDADKPNYATYYELCLKLVAPGGLIAVDNTLWSGEVVDPKAQDADTVAIRALNAQIAADERVDPAMLPVGDGLTLARVR